jgi:hypothetical protein
MVATINSEHILKHILIFHCALNEFNIIPASSKTLLLEGITKWLTWMEISRTRKNQKS